MEYSQQIENSKKLCVDCYYKKNNGCCAPDEVPSEGCQFGDVYLEPYRCPETGKLLK